MTGTTKKQIETNIPTRRKSAAKSVLTRKSPQKSSQVATAAPLVQCNTTKRDQLAAMLLSDTGATIDQMVADLGWLPHTVRAAMTGLKKVGYLIDSDKIDGLRTYRAVAPK